MKPRHAIVFASLTLFIAACNFTLAADVTPPPDYVPPPPMPTLGPLFPASGPDINNGAIIYTEKCSPCHGETGLGDGPQGILLEGISVPAFGLPEIAQKSTPANWYKMVTQGNLDRFMPPFSSLSEQERWDVISYALTLHTTPEQIAAGKNLFESNCADCAEKFRDQKIMAALSENDLVRIIKKGEGDIPAFGSNFTDDQAIAVAAYLRGLTFALPATPAPVSATETPIAAEAGTPSAETTPGAVTPQATNVAGIGNITGTIDNQTGGVLPSNLKVTLRAYEHGGDPSAGPQEISAVDGTVNPDGTYLFQDVEIPENRIYISEVEVDGVTYESDFAVAEAGMTELTMPAITLYGTTTDLSGLAADSVVIHFDFADPENIGVFIVYSMFNTGTKTIEVVLENNGQDIPFIKAPANTGELGLQITQESARWLGSEDGSRFFIPPSEQAYEIIAFTNLVKEDKVEFGQEFALPVEAVHVFVPEGVIAASDQLANDGSVSLPGPDGQPVNYQTYSMDGIEAGDTLTFALSGEPESTSVNPDITQNQTLLIGVGALGLALILAGGWLYWRDRNRVQEEDRAESEFDEPESIMDSIIALDDLHRAGKLSDEAYKQRRNEMKNALKKNS